VPGAGVLIFFALVGAFICARARVAGGAMVFAVVAAVLFVTTPLGAGLPGAISEFLSGLDRASAPVLGQTDGPGAG
jgi:hypothetical protein